MGILEARKYVLKWVMNVILAVEMSTSVLSGYCEICQTPFSNPLVRAKSFPFRRLGERPVGRGRLSIASTAWTLTDLRWRLAESSFAVAILTLTSTN
jgi:hypothetical protein